MKYLILLSITMTLINPLSAQKTLFFTGTTNAKEINSIAVCELDESKSEISIISKMKGGQRPGYIAISKDRKFLYAVSSEYFEGNKNENSLNAFKIEKESWSLTPLNQQSSMGINPCYISLSPSGKTLFTANYTSGSISSYPVLKNGSIGKSISFFQLEGTGPDKSRQEGPHAHYISTSIDGKYVYATDLGTDKVMIYKLDKKGRLLENKDSKFLNLDPGAGPRHMVFHKNGKFVYIINELNNEVVSCVYNASNGTLTVVDKDKTTSEKFEGKSSSAAIHIHPGGKYLYSSNRGENCISVFKIENDGSLTNIQIFTEGMGMLRDFNISPSGLFLIAGNQAENELVLLKIDENGKLSSTGQILSLSEPTCVVFY
ncbi:MAG: lactonase family protein [Bacteroidales bacterium]|nr:lactonase family protein [Bacteroidales bacterium]MCF8391644.1 lactonase family protein [Bacteroidales bacterium]